MVYKSFDKKIRSPVKANVNEVLAQESQKPAIKKFRIRKVFSSFKDNISATDLVEMVSASFKNRGVKYLLFVIDVFTKYTWVKLLKKTKAKTVLHGFIEMTKNLKVNQINHGLSKEDNFTITLCKNV